MLLGNSHALVAQQNRDSFDRNSRKKQFDRKRVAETMRMSIRNVCEFEEFAQSRLQLRTMLSSFPLPLQKKNFSVTFGVASSADKTKPGSTVFTRTPVFCVYRNRRLPSSLSVLKLTPSQFASRCNEAIEQDRVCAGHSSARDSASPLCIGRLPREFAPSLRGQMEGWDRG